MESLCYDDWYQNWLNESPHKRKIADFLIEFFKKKSSGAKRIQKVLSVGSGEGVLDIPILRYGLPSVTHYSGIEPRSSAIEKFKLNFEKINWKERCIKTEFHNGSIEDFQSPRQQVDLVILGHMMYYVMDYFQSIIEKCIAWLNPGGMILLSHSAPNDCWMEIGDIVREEGIEYRKFHSMYRKCMDELKLKRFTVEDHRVENLQMDFAEPSTESVIKLVTNISNLSKQQLNEIKEIIKSHSLPVTMLVPYENLVTVVHK